MTKPRVSVLMSVYNDEKHLEEAIDSILKQTYTDFEFIIINDTSTDSSREIIISYADPRIKLIDNESNMGLTLSLNKGLKLAQGDYIARMDSDDISLPERLVKQVTFMDDHPEVGVCGSWVSTIGDAAMLWKHPTDAETIKCHLLFGNTLAHSSVIMRRNLLDLHHLSYNPQCARAQDYELWARCARIFPLANIDEVLVLYRLHSNRITNVYQKEQEEYANLARLQQLEHLGIKIGVHEIDLHERLSTWRYESTKEFVLDAERWLRKLHKANSGTLFYPEPAFSKILGERWLTVCHYAMDLGFWTSRHRLFSPLSRWAGIGWRDLALQWVLRSTTNHIDKEDI